MYSVWQCEGAFCSVSQSIAVLLQFVAVCCVRVCIYVMIAFGAWRGSQSSIYASSCMSHSHLFFLV